MCWSWSVLAVLNSDKSLSRRVPNDFVFHPTQRGDGIKKTSGPGLGLVVINQPGDLFRVNPVCVGRRLCLLGQKKWNTA